jgi:Cu/Ag efflux protein CusF
LTKSNNLTKRNNLKGQKPMRRIKTKTIIITLLPAVVLALTCYSKLSAQTDEGAAAAQGAIEAEVAKATFTVSAIDTAKRTVTLKGTDGTTRTVKCSKEVVNFPQIKVGDNVTVAIVESIAVAVHPKGAPPSADERGAVALAPVGAKPGGIMARTTKISAKVEAVDAAAHTVTVKGPLGKERTFKVNPRVDLSALKTGDEIVLRVTDALAIDVTAPTSQ